MSSDPDEHVAPTEITSLEYAPAEQQPRHWGKGFLAVTATILLPGLGHLIVGRRARAAFWFLLAVVWTLVSIVAAMSPRLVIVFVLTVVVEAAFRLASFVDAFVCARRSRRDVLGSAWVRYALGVICIVGAVLLKPNVHLALHICDRYVEAFALSNTRSMAPTLVPGDRFLAHKRARVQRWSVVVIHHPQFGAGVAVATRVVGLPGETIEIVGGQVRVDGQPVTPPAGVGPYMNLNYLGRLRKELYGHPGAGCEGNPIQLADREYFVLGDNSTLALDGRLWETEVAGHQLGALPGHHVVGVVTAVYWPPSRWMLLGP